MQKRFFLVILISHLHETVTNMINKMGCFSIVQVVMRMFWELFNQLIGLSKVKECGSRCEHLKKQTRQIVKGPF